MAPGKETCGLGISVFKQHIHVGDGKHAIVDAIDAKERRAGTVENPLIQQRQPRAIFHPLRSSGATESTREGFSQLEWILAALCL